MTWQIHTGDCIEVMAEMPEASVDAIVCDPPYSLGFMGRSWDSHGEGEDVGFGYYLSGLIDGEGHFRVGAGERRCEFGMKLRDDDRWILERARLFIGHGRIHTEKRRDGSAPQVKLIIDSKDGCAALCSLLMRYPLRAKKLRDFLTWAEAVDEWLTMPRGNRWHGPADRARLAELGERLRSERVYSEVPWSGNAFQDWCRRWAAEALRVLKPGGHLLAFGGSRTYHRLAAGVEDAGFEVRDQIQFLYGSGFPKSLDVSKAIDKAAGAEREVVGSVKRPDIRNGNGRGYGEGIDAGQRGGPREYLDHPISAPATPEAAQWQGWGTALKPAHEPIVVARKPLAGTVAANVLEFGTGALNVDGCRIGTEDDTKRPPSDTTLGIMNDDGWEPKPIESGGHAAGRWPANVVFSHTEDCVAVGTRKVATGTASPKSRGLTGGIFGDGSGEGHPGGYADEDGTETVTQWECVEGCPIAALDAQTGELVSGPESDRGHRRNADSEASRNAYGGFQGQKVTGVLYGDRGGASRFFYTAKASRAEREAGLDGFVLRTADPYGEHRGRRMDDKSRFDGEPARVGRNHHPTVKPIDLMRWLVRLVTPPGGVVLDPFTGSGSTGCAAVLEGFDFIGCEREAEYVAIAEARIAFWAQHVGREVDDVLGLVGASARESRRHEEAGQIGLEIHA